MKIALISLDLATVNLSSLDEGSAEVLETGSGCESFSPMINFHTRSLYYKLTYSYALGRMSSFVLL